MVSLNQMVRNLIPFERVTNRKELDSIRRIASADVYEAVKVQVSKAKMTHQEHCSLKTMNTTHR